MKRDIEALAANVRTQRSKANRAAILQTRYRGPLAARVGRTRLQTTGRSMTRSFNCHQCGFHHTLTDKEESECRISPWTRTCQCGSGYQLYPDRIHHYKWGAGWDGPQRKSKFSLPPLPIVNNASILPPLPQLKALK